MRLARWLGYTMINEITHQSQLLGFKSQNVHNARWLEYTDNHVKFKARKADMCQGHADFVTCQCYSGNRHS